jgi:putative hydrolase of the HAD superfamily
MTGTEVMVVSDADNTLWDTNSVYAKAQLKLLEEIEQAVGKQLADDDRLSAVRWIDQLIAAQSPENFSYPPYRLAAALRTAILWGLAAERLATTVKEALEVDLSHAEAFAVMRYRGAVQGTTPKLRNGVVDGLELLLQREIQVTVFTETNLDRCNRLLQEHGLSRFVGRVVSARKCMQEFLKILRSAGPVRSAFMIGDHLDRDIGPAAEAGFTTIWYPGGLQTVNGGEKASGRPDVQVSSFYEAAAIVVKRIRVSRSE